MPAQGASEGGSPFRQKLGEGASDPDVDREAVPMPEAKKQSAVGHLFSNADDLHQLGAGLRGRKGGQGGEIDRSAGHLPGGVDQVTRPKAAAQRCEILGRKTRQTFGRGKGAEPAADGVPELAAETLDDAGDALDVVVLAEDEAGERLPSVLPQNPDAAREAAGGSRAGIEATIRRIVS